MTTLAVRFPEVVQVLRRNAAGWFVIGQAVLVVGVAFAMLAGPLMIAAAEEVVDRAEITLARLG